MTSFWRASRGRSVISLGLALIILAFLAWLIPRGLSWLPLDSDNSPTNRSHNGLDKHSHIQLDALRSGIDVSHYQGLIHWPQVAKQDIYFAYVKATGGHNYIDPKFSINWHGVRTTNLRRGAYHFFLASSDAKQQAIHFVNTVSERKLDDLSPMLDIEVLDGIDPKTLVDKLIVWLDIVEKSFNRTPVIYSDLSFANSYLDDPRLSRYPFWVADYGKTMSQLPQNWKKSSWAIWQHSDTGNIEGIEGDVDLNMAHPSFLTHDKHLLNIINHER